MSTTPTAITPPHVAGKLTQLFPQVTIHWVTCGAHVVPVERGFLLEDETEQSYWQFHPERGNCSSNLQLLATVGSIKLRQAFTHT